MLAVRHPTSPLGLLPSPRNQSKERTGHTPRKPACWEGEENLILLLYLSLSLSTGRGCQVRGEDRLQWSKHNLDAPLKTGDIVGCAWIRGDQGGGAGVMYYTLNGAKLDHVFNKVPPGLYPFVHLQKKVSFINSQLEL